MAGRQRQSGHGNFAATAAIFVLAAWFAAPVLAAPEPGVLCDKNSEATLEIKTDKVATTIEAVDDDHVLKPRVEATAREVFADGSSETETEEAEKNEADDEAASPRLRRLSDNEMVPFKRQMYRRDI